MRLFLDGFKAMLPITPGVLPFGTVMGTVCADANLDIFQTVGMNFFVFGGASQLVAVDLMTKNTVGLVVVITGLIINLRFMLYSAALSPVVQRSNFLVKMTSAYFLTDQNYAVMSAHSHKLKNNTESLTFYFGASVCMMLTWHSAVIAGFIFGNFAPSALALDYAVPLSFVALTMPTIRNKTYLFVAVFTSGMSLVLSYLPYNLGLIVTALMGIGLATFITRPRKGHD